MGLLLQLKFLGLSVLVLAEIAASIAYVNHIVRFKSGLDNNETLRRMWAKPEQVIFQPVMLPILLSWIVGLGVNSLVRSVMVGFLQLIDALRIAGELSLAGDFAVTVSGTAAGTIAGTLLYIIDGGLQLPYQVLGTLAISLGISLPRVIGHGPGSVTLWVIVISAIVIGISVWIKTRGVIARVPTSSVRELRVESLQSTLAGGTRVKYWLSFIGGISLLSILRIMDYLIILYIERNGYEQIYLAQMLRNFAGLMVLISCSFVAILVANLNINARLFIWQWPSALCPMFLLGLCESLLTVLHPGRPSDVYGWGKVLLVVKRTFMYGAAGFLGSTVYLGVLTRAASQALDPGIEGQSELIVDDDSESEYEIEA